jgi:hypothetical protein
MAADLNKYFNFTAIRKIQDEEYTMNVDVINGTDSKASCLRFTGQGHIWYGHLDNCTFMLHLLRKGYQLLIHHTTIS